MIEVTNKHTGERHTWRFNKFRTMRPQFKDEEYLALRKSGRGESQHEWYRVI